MTYFSGSWAYDVRARVSNPNWTIGLTAFLSVAVHCVFLFYVLPVTSIQLPMESSFGQVSLQLVATRPVAAQKPRRQVVVEPPKKTVETPKEIVKEITPAPIQTPEPVAQVVAAAEPVQEIQEQPPVQTDPVTEPSPAPAADARPSTGSREGESQEVQVSMPAYSSNPKPEYPLAAQRAGSEGRVLLRVEVSETGDAVSLSIEKSSGYRILDLAAERAVMKWKFIPASRGRTNISSVCVVPIRFNLQEGVKIE